MSEVDSGVLKCPICLKEYPPSSSSCPDDGAKLVSAEVADLKSTRVSQPPLENDGDTQGTSLIGKVFAEKYDILSMLGQGGMSKVYKARHKLMKRIVAVKLLHESATQDETARARFQQEAEACSALNHQNVVTVHDFGFTPSGQAFFVMDCLEGKTLEQILEEYAGPMPLAEAIDIFTQGCDGLDHAHRKGIVHRDIKPSNIVVIKQDDGSDLVKIVDFGIAKVLTPAPEGEKQRQLTQQGEVFGTPAYMSPEQCSGKDLDGRSDLYSFGCMMYEALSGQPPHVGETFINTIVKHISEKPKSIAETAPEARVPSHVEEVVMRCLEKDPKDRYASAVELKQALYDAAFASGVKGLRFGAVPEPRISGTNRSGTPGQWGGSSLSEKKVTRRWRMSFTITISLVAIAVTAGSLWIFLYPGPDGDKGTIFNKMMWQRHLGAGDDNLRQQNYKEAVKELDQARVLANSFGDGKGRLETTLNKLSDAYGFVHDYAAQEAVNKELAQISTERLYNEYDLLIALLAEWEKPTTSATVNQERSLQAVAFAQRISLCAEKLFTKSREKEVLLLKKAIHVFDMLDNKEWKSAVQFRVLLAECYRKQQRFDLLRSTLNDAIHLCPEKPPFAAGWRTKIHALVLLAQLDRNEAMNGERLDRAREELENCLKMTKENLPNDKEMLRDIYSSLMVMHNLYHTKEHDAKAKEYEQLANSTTTNGDSPDD